MLAVPVASFINFLYYCSPSSTFYGAWKDNRGICTDNLSGRHPIWTIGTPTSIILPTFMLNALSAAILPIYRGLGWAPNNAWLGSLIKLL